MDPQMLAFITAVVTGGVGTKLIEIIFTRAQEARGRRQRSEVLSKQWEAAYYQLLIEYKKLGGTSEKLDPVPKN